MGEHRRQTTVTHWIDLDDRERFEVASYSGKPHIVVALQAHVVDGSLSWVEGKARRVLKSGELSGNVTRIHFWRGDASRRQADAVLRAHGIKTPDGAA